MKPGLRSRDTAYGESTSPPKDGKKRNVPRRRAYGPAPDACRNARATAGRLRLSIAQGGTASPATGPAAARKRPLQAPPAPAGWVSATGRRHGPPSLASRELSLRPHGAPGLSSAAGERWRRATPLRGLGRGGSAGSSWKLRQPCGFLPPRRSVRRISPPSCLGRSRHSLPAPRRQHGADRLTFPFFHKQVSTPQETAYAADPHTCTVWSRGSTLSHRTVSGTAKADRRMEQFLSAACPPVPEAGKYFSYPLQTVRSENKVILEIWTKVMHLEYKKDTE